MNKEITSGIRESPNKAISALSKFISNFKQKKVIVESPIINLDESYTSRYDLSRLIGAEDDKIYVYDERYWCRGCRSNCNLYKNELIFMRMSEERSKELAKALAQTNMEWNLVGRNLLLQFTGAPIDMHITSYTEWDRFSKKQELWAQIDVSHGGNIRSTRPSYNQGLKIIEKFREIVV